MVILMRCPLLAGVMEQIRNDEARGMIKTTWRSMLQNHHKQNAKPSHDVLHHHHHNDNNDNDYSVQQIVRIVSAMALASGYCSMSLLYKPQAG